jgi:hypothetical protein
MKLAEKMRSKTLKHQD